MIDATQWSNLRRHEPEGVVRRALAEYDPAQGIYRLHIMREEILISPAKETVSWPEDTLHAKPMEPECALVAVTYLLTARERELIGKWVSPSLLPYGKDYFADHPIPTHAIAEAFKNRAKTFVEVAERMGGRHVHGAELAYELHALPRVPVILRLKKKEKGVYRAGFYFDESATDHLSVEAIQALTVIITNRFLEEASYIS